MIASVAFEIKVVVVATHAKSRLEIVMYKYSVALKI